MQHAVALGLRADDPTREVKPMRIKSDGHHSWDDREIHRFEAHHAIGSRARLAFALLLYTGQRRGDVCRMGRQHVRDGGILHVRQEKTGVELDIPIHPALAEIIGASPTGNLTFVTTRTGAAFSSNSFGEMFRTACVAASLPHCSAHGLRKAAARRLAEAGATAHEIAAITGHASLREVQRYTKAADQKMLAQAAMGKVTVPLPVHRPLSNPAEGLTISAKKPAKST
jgi:integrase